MMIFGISEAQALDGKCLLEVNGQVYIKGICNIETWKDGLSIGAGDLIRSHHFAYVNIGPDHVAQGFWNGLKGEAHADENLGRLVRHGACWVNELARVCAWR
jgi:hypothetical protein